MIAFAEVVVVVGAIVAFFGAWTLVRASDPVGTAPSGFRGMLIGVGLVLLACASAFEPEVGLRSVLTLFLVGVTLPLAISVMPSAGRRFRRRPLRAARQRAGRPNPENG